MVRSVGMEKCFSFLSLGIALFGEPASTPHQVRGRLSPEHALTGRPAGCRLWPDPRPLRQTNEILHRPHAELAHHPTAMDLDGLFHRAEIAGDLLVEPAGHHVGEDLALNKQEPGA